MHVHRAFGVGVGRLEHDAGDELDGAGQLQVLEAQRILGVQPVDQVLDVGQGVLRMHEPDTEHSSSRRLITTVVFIGK
jgi:hypothetical protein